METPKNARVAGRNPTPRLSERKKSLFASKEEAQRDLSEGIVPLEDESTKSDSRYAKSKRSITSLLTLNEQPKSLRFFSDDDQVVDSTSNETASPSRRSLRLNPKINIATTPPSRRSPRHSIIGNSPMKKREQGKENMGPEEQLQLLFDSSMKLDGSSKVRTDKSSENVVITNESNTDAVELYKIQDKKCKRPIESPSSASKASPQRKVRRLDDEVAKPENNYISTKSFYSISKDSPPTAKAVVVSPAKRVIATTSPKSYRHQRRGANSINKGVRHKIRRRPKTSVTYSSADVDNILNNLRNEKLRKLITSNREQKIQIDKIHHIFKSGQNPIEMARPLTAISNGIDYTNNNNKSRDAAEEKTIKNSDSASVSADIEFSDIECNSEDGDNEVDDVNFDDVFSEKEEVIPLITHQSPQTPTKSEELVCSPAKIRKFFKSGHATTTRKEITITENIKASVCNGKISIVEKKKRRRRIKLKNSHVNEFSDEQATVDAILKNLDDTTYGDTSATNSSIKDIEIHNSNSEECSNNHTDMFDVQLDDEADYSEFRSRLPYNTNDPELIEQQNLLLDFLINNNICTEENFQIFIADPDNHKEEASRIVDQVIVVVNEQADFRHRIPYNTDDSETIEQQHKILDFLIENDICTDDNFDIFIANYEQRYEEAEVIVQQVIKKNQSKYKDNSLDNSNTMDIHSPSEYGMEVEIGNQNISEIQNVGQNIALEQTPVSKDTDIIAHSAKPEKLFPLFDGTTWKPLVHKSTRKPPRTFIGGFGSKQYQIDAGQKKFGAHQCKQCGLVYTVHEPEEEKLHRDYHSSLHVLRYKGWLDEDIVNVLTEWSPDGKIIKITDKSPYKRRERLMDVLKVVDKELGFSSYIVPKAYAAYFAVRKFQIVGLCLVHPLQKANKYICVDGIDCCTEEEFEVKCGVSRIWVSPLHRRLHIGTKLIQAVQSNTIYGEEIPLDKIAFSAPTESGKNFARKITKTENFLVYQ